MGTMCRPEFGDSSDENLDAVREVSIEPKPKEDCEREDCLFQRDPAVSTDMYYPPRYDRHGVNQNPDRNVVSHKEHCITCERSWTVTRCGDDQPTRKEILPDD